MQQYHLPLFRTKILSDFWPNANEARARFEGFVGNPQTHTFEGPHQCWDFWYMRDVYCYLRTDPAKVIGNDLVEDFVCCLDKLCQTELNDVKPLGPWMSLHLNGMRHEIHNDSCNGT